MKQNFTGKLSIKCYDILDGVIFGLDMMTKYGFKLDLKGKILEISKEEMSLYSPY